MHQAGLINYATRKLFNTIKNPYSLGGKQKHGDSNEMLMLFELIGALFTLGTGLCTVVDALIGELFFSKVRKGRHLDGAFLKKEKKKIIFKNCFDY